MFVIPADRLPPGFAERVDSPPADPAPPRPAATAVLLRDGESGPEALLLRRHRASGFVPGAYVFPGGRVDEADADPRLLERSRGAPRAGSAPAAPDGPGRGAVGGPGPVAPDSAGPAIPDGPAPVAPDDAGPAVPDPSFGLAAIREVFEETGVLLARCPDGSVPPDAASSPEAEAWREALMGGRATLLDVAEALDVRPALDALVYCAHWITPTAEPRRYDTRFFLARLPEGRTARPDAREMTDAVWLTPADALARFREGRLPMVFPTVRTLEALAGFASTEEALEAFRHRPVRTILPRLVRTPEGVAIVD